MRDDGRARETRHLTQRKEGNMEWMIFFVGTMVGASFGVVVMSLLQMVRDDEPTEGGDAIE